MLDLHEGVLEEFAERGCRQLDSYAGMSVGTNPNPRDERSGGDLFLEGDAPGGIALAHRQVQKAASYRPWAASKPGRAPKRPGPPPTWTKDTILALVQGGRQYAEVAAMLGCSKSTVARHFAGQRRGFYKGRRAA